MPLLLTSTRTSLAERLSLPSDRDNLFGRLIRDPYAGTAMPKERECTEMLCVLLRNTERVRDHLLAWMARLLGQTSPAGELATYAIETEQQVEGKRDDLRIVGFRDSDESIPAVVWTIEVKVAAPMHYSSPIQGIFSEGAGNGLQSTLQIENYDHWLTRQPAEQKGGVVISLGGGRMRMPDTLVCTWVVTSWTRLGLEIARLLESEHLPEVERFLATHVLGFIREYLWSAEEMDSLVLEFDDVAFLRANAQIGRQVETKIDRLVSQLKSVLEACGVGQGPITHQQSLYKPMRRSAIYRALCEVGQYPTIMMGVDRWYVQLWVETAPTNSNKKPIREACQELLPALQARDSRWNIPEHPWPDLEIRQDINELLAATDQQSAFLGFFELALDGLKAVDIQGRLTQAMQGHENEAGVELTESSADK